MAILGLAAKACLLFAVSVLLLYATRHYVLSFSRLFQKRSRDMMELTGFVLPRVTVLVPMHNEEKVAADILRALVESDYDRDRLEVFAINDRSEDRTGEIIDEYAAKYPIIHAVHRTEGKGGKGEALKEVTWQASGEILLLFDADYFPGRSMLKFLVTPFCDPQVGAVMGRVVPHNAEASLLAALLSLERAAGYQIGQQVRHNLGLTPQFGGTVGGVRVSALKAVGGWDSESLTEDTDLTFRLVAKGWKVTYVNRAECYEEVPQAWEVRKKQITRWATGHTECLHRLWPSLLRSKFLTTFEKADAMFVLACYLTAPILILGWLASLALFFTHQAGAATALSVALGFVGYQIFGNQATFFELGSAALLDGTYQRVLLIPINLFNFFSSTTAITTALLRFYWSRIWGGRGPRWHKTKRYRGKEGKETFAGNGSAMKLFTQGTNGIYVRHYDSGQT